MLRIAPREPLRVRGTLWLGGTMRFLPDRAPRLRQLVLSRWVTGSRTRLLFPLKPRPSLALLHLAIRYLTVVGLVDEILLLSQDVYAIIRF